MTDTLTCPSCSEPSLLTAVDRGGVVVDACSRCRGVWLDRGELDKLIALEAAPGEEFLAEIRGNAARSDAPPTDARGLSKHDSKSSGHGQKKKRGGFLGDFFDLG